MNNNAKAEILKEKRVSYSIKKKYFFNDDEISIRDKLEQMYLNRHMPIEVQKVEIVLVTPKGILMQIKFKNPEMLGLWEGFRKLTEDPYDCVRRTFFEQTKLEIEDSKFEFINLFSFTNEDENGNQLFFKSFMYMVQLEKIPQIENSKILSVKDVASSPIYEYQKNFIRNAIIEIEQRKGII